MKIEFELSEYTFAQNYTEILSADSPGPEYTCFDMFVYWWIDGVNVLRLTDREAIVPTNSKNTAYIPILLLVGNAFTELRRLESGGRTKACIGCAGWIIFERRGRTLQVSTTAIPMGRSCSYEEAVAELGLFSARVRKSFETHAPSMKMHPAFASWFRTEITVNEGSSRN